MRYTAEADWVSTGEENTAHSEFGGFGTRPVEAQHDDLQAMAAIGALEESWTQKVWGEVWRKVYAPVC